MTKEEKWILIGNERFYYQEIRLFHGRGKMDVEVARENLQIFYNIIEKSEIRYGLFFGTLLGAIRDSNFITHDEDIDIFVLNEDKEKFLRLLTEFKEQGLNLVRFDSDVISLMRRNEYIDINFFRLKNKLGILKVRECCHEFECAAKFLENPVKYWFLGMHIPIPNNPEKLLFEMYGRNWRTPVANFPAPSNTIYKRISNNASKIRELPFYHLMERFTKKLLRKLGL